MHAYKKNDKVFVNGVDYKRLANELCNHGTDLANAKPGTNEALNILAKALGYRDWRDINTQAAKPLHQRGLSYVMLDRHMQQECDAADFQRLAVQHLGEHFKDQLLPRHFNSQWKSDVDAMLRDAMRMVRGKKDQLVLVVGKSGTGKTAALKHLAATSRGLIHDVAFPNLVSGGFFERALRKLKAKPDLLIFDGGKSHAEAVAEYWKPRISRMPTQHDNAHPTSEAPFYTGCHLRPEFRTDPLQTPWPREEWHRPSLLQNGFTPEPDNVVRIVSVSSASEALWIMRPFFTPAASKKNPYPIDKAVVVNLDEMKLQYTSPISVPHDTKEAVFTESPVSA